MNLSYDFNNFESILVIMKHDMSTHFKAWVINMVITKLNNFNVIYTDDL